MLKEAIILEKLGQEVRDYLSKYIKVNKVIVYGSYAYGEPKDESDIDIAIISENFNGMSLLKKIEILSGVSLAIDSRIEVKGFTLEEYDKAQPGSLIELIKKQGKEIN